VLISKISASFVPSGRPWDLTEPSTYEKQCRRLGFRKCKQNWELLTAPAQPKVLPVPKAAVKRPNAATVSEFATKQDLDEVKRALREGWCSPAFTNDLLLLNIVARTS
jgi:hypothetical protein